MQDEYTAAAKITPAAAGTIYSQLTLNDWVAIITIAYVALQIGLLIPKYRAQYPVLWGRVKAALLSRLKALWLRFSALFGKAGA